MVARRWSTSMLGSRSMLLGVLIAMAPAMPYLPPLAMAAATDVVLLAIAPTQSRAMSGT